MRGLLLIAPFVTDMPDRPKRPAPLSLRLTPEDRERLENAAAGMSLGSYIRWRVFDPASPPPRHRGKFPVKDHAALSALLGKLGASLAASNLNQLAKAANSGSLVLDPDIEAELRQALSDIADMRRLLLEALGLEVAP